MDTKSTEKPTLIFWAIALVSLLWNGMGSANYIMQMDPEMVANFPQSHRAVIENRPPWATSAFAIAVFGGALGSLLLLLRKRSAILVFLAALFGAIATLIHSLKVPDGPLNSATSEIVLTIVMPVLVAMLLLWYARRCADKGWLG